MWDPTLPTTVANTAAILAGAHILRVHDIPPARAAAAIADRILSAR
jgi:dihydropteroate synthase